MGDLPISDWKAKTVPNAHNKKIHTVAFNADGKRLASGSADQMIKIWKADDQTISSKAEKELRAPYAVTALAWHPTNPDRLASLCDNEKAVRFWDMQAGKNTATVSTPGVNLYLAWSPDGQQVAVGSKDDVVSLLDTRKMKIAAKYSYKYQVNEIAYSRDGKLFFQGIHSGDVEVLSLPGMQRVRLLRGHTGPVLSLAFDRQERYMATGGTDALVSLWDARDFICLRTFSRMDHPIRSVRFSHDGKYVAIAGEDPAIDVENVETGASLGRLALRAPAEDCAWNPTHPMLAYPGDKTGRDPVTNADLWSLEIRARPFILSGF